MVVDSDMVFSRPAWVSVYCQPRIVVGRVSKDIIRDVLLVSIGRVGRWDGMGQCRNRCHLPYI